MAVSMCASSTAQDMSYQALCRGNSEFRAAEYTMSADSGAEVLAAKLLTTLHTFKERVNSCTGGNLLPVARHWTIS
jgi:hypothetical protein